MSSRELPFPAFLSLNNPLENVKDGLPFFVFQFLDGASNLGFDLFPHPAFAAADISSGDRLDGARKNQDLP